MEEKITKQDILTLVRAEFDGLHGTIHRITREDMLKPGVEGEWSIKDILCHLSAWRRLYIVWTEALLDGKEPDRPAPDQSWDTLDEFNQALFDKNRGTSLQDALVEFVNAHTDSLSLIERLSEPELLDPDRFTWRKGDPLWRMVAGNTWLHDKEHHETIQRWLEIRGG